MTNQEIANKIKELNEKKEALIDPTTFVLNEEVVLIDREIFDLQGQCAHEYENDVCKWCGKTRTIILFTTEHCPQCKVIKEMLNEKQIAYQVVSEEIILKTFGIEQVPQLQVDGGELIAGPRAISKWISAQEVTNG